MRRLEKLRAKRAFEATLPPIDDVERLPERQVSVAGGMAASGRVRGPSSSCLAKPWCAALSSCDCQELRAHVCNSHDLVSCVVLDRP